MCICDRAEELETLPNVPRSSIQIVRAQRDDRKVQEAARDQVSVARSTAAFERLLEQWDRTTIVAPDDAFDPEIAPGQGRTSHVTTAESEIQSLVVQCIGTIWITEIPARVSKMGDREDQPARLAELAEKISCFLELQLCAFGLAARFGNVGYAENRPGSCQPGHVLADGKCTFIPVSGLLRVSAVPPKAPDRPGEHERSFAVGRVARIGERLANVVVFDPEPVVPLTLLRASQLRFGLLDEREEVVQKAIADL